MFTHVNEEGYPRMVDVAGKAVTARLARARCRMYLPLPIIPSLRSPDGDLRGPKGPVFQTAVVAGIQAAKRTWDLIPMCHPIPLDHCEIRIEIRSETELELHCEVRATHRTGVEMEALTGVSVAALTVYDMCKALSPEIEIRETILVEKRGGKRAHVRA